MSRNFVRLFCVLTFFVLSSGPGCAATSTQPAAGDSKYAFPSTSPNVSDSVDQAEKQTLQILNDSKAKSPGGHDGPGGEPPGGTPQPVIGTGVTVERIDMNRLLKAPDGALSGAIEQAAVTVPIEKHLPSTTQMSVYAAVNWVKANQLMFPSTSSLDLQGHVMGLDERNSADLIEARDKYLRDHSGVDPKTCVILQDAPQHLAFLVVGSGDQAKWVCVKALPFAPLGLKVGDEKPQAELLAGLRDAQASRRGNGP